MSRAERRALVEREHPPLPISHQCRLLAVSRSAVYRTRSLPAKQMAGVPLRPCGDFALRFVDDSQLEEEGFELLVPPPRAFGPNGRSD